MLNLAFSDLSVGLLVQPFHIITFSFESQEGDNLQKMQTLSLVIGIAFVCASGVLALIVDRFLAVYLHLRYQEIVTPKRVVSILILSWVISTIVSLFWIVQEYHDFLWIFLNVFFASCLTTIALLQCKIYSIVRRHDAIDSKCARSKCKEANKLRMKREQLLSAKNLQYAAHSTYIVFF